MKLLLAGPGTGKTTKVKEIINENYKDLDVQVVSFTNATIDDLSQSFKDYANVNCATLHSFALRINHLPNFYVLNETEKKIIENLSEKIEIDFSTTCDLLSCISFDNMILSCTSFLKSNPAYAKEVVGNLDLLIVDEFQDFNPNEQELIFLLSNYCKETIILGDDDQSIYSFKDAAPDGIINLFHNEKIEKIEHENKCYRCPDEIVDFCSKMIKINKNRIEKQWLKIGKSGVLSIEQLTTLNDTDERVIEIIKEIRKRDDEGSILILSSVEFAVNSLRKKLYHNGMVFRDFWSKVMDEEELIRTWWLKAIYLNNTILYLILIAGINKMFSNRPFINKLKQHFNKDCQSQEFIKDLFKHNIYNDYKEYILVKPLISEFFEKHSEFEKIKSYIDPENIERSLKNLNRFIYPKVDFKKGGINIMSIHKSKGLQAEYVLILGVVSGILPNKKKGLDTIEAQRRLLFVGMTRALKELYLPTSMEWNSSDIHTVDKSQFKFAFWRKKTASKPKSVGKVSMFIEEILNKQ